MAVSMSANIKYISTNATTTTFKLDAITRAKLFKFNLVFLIVFLIGLAATGLLTRSLLERNAQDEVLQQARFLFDKALAVRAYTSKQVAPLLETQMKYAFLPQSVPAFSATEVMAALAKNHAEYSYKEATINPTNPRDRAIEWEADVIGEFRKSPDAKEFVLSNHSCP